MDETDELFRRGDQEAEKLQEARSKERIDAFKAVFSTDEGQRVLNDICRFAGLMGDGFQPDPYVTAYNSGRRSVAIFILTWMEMDRERTQALLRQHDM